MRTTVGLKIEILSYWHVGSGAGRGASLDALVLKDGRGLPYLPGRSLKGLLREGWQCCEDAGQIAAGRTDQLFGSPAPPGQYDGSIPGVLDFRDAALPDVEARWLASDEGAEMRAALFDPFASTALDTRGMAQEHTLRAIELCVPLTLFAHISGPAREAWLAELPSACLLVRALGSHRNRGLGRCRLSLETPA